MRVILTTREHLVSSLLQRLLHVSDHMINQICQSLSVGESRFIALYYDIQTI